MNLAGLAAIARRYQEARELRIATGMWLHATEIRVHDRGQLLALREHAECGGPLAAPLGRLTGVSIIYDADVPVGTLRVVLEDGSSQDHRIT